MSEQTQSVTRNSSWKSEYQEIQQAIRDETLLGGMVLLIVTGAFLIMNLDGIGSSFWVTVSAVTGYVFAFAAYLLFRRFPMLAAAAIVSALFLITGLLLWEVHLTDAIYLVVLITGFVTLSLGIKPGAGLAAAFTMCLLAAPQSILPATGFQRGLVMLLMGATTGMIWVGLRSLLHVIGWAWEGYRTNLVSLKQAHASQEKLQDSLENLKEANSQLTRLNQLTQNLRLIAEDERRIKEAFVANVSHELRTPLNMIIGFCGMILQSPQAYGHTVPPKLLVDLEIIYRNSQHLSSLIDDVLDMSQIDAGKMALSKEKVSIPLLISEAVTAVQPLYQSKGLYLNVNVAESLPFIWCDSTRIREVLMNLLSNAGRFTEEGGITLKAEQKGSNLLVSVADTGPGMTTEERNRLFRPFEQLDNSIRRRYGGTGLGLAISKSFVEMHDGKIWVESEKNVGTTFTFQLPVEPISIRLAGPARWLNLYSNHDDLRHYHLEPMEKVKPRLLVVEKGNVMKKLLMRYFPSMDISPASELEDALQRLEKENAMALLVNEPMVSQSLDRLRESGALPMGIPAIVCSIAGEEQASEEFGVANYLVKPIHREVLLEAIHHLKAPIQNILVVDDEPDARQLFKRMLDSAEDHYQVIRAEDGEMALEELEARKIDLILLDLSMPKLDGFQFLAFKNANPAWKHIPVILISARDPYGHPITSSALGVTCGNGLSTRQILACVEALTAILAPFESTEKPTLPVPPE